MIDLSADMTAIVPIRKGSQRIPGKNLRAFWESPAGESFSLLEWKLRQLLEVFQGDQILVSTDWDLAADISRGFGCLVHERDEFLAGPDAPFDQVIAGVVAQVETSHAMWCPATSPLIGPRCVRQFLEKYWELPPEERDEGLIVVSRTRSYCFMGGSPINFRLGAGHVRTQEIEPIEILNWALTARPVSRILDDSYMFSELAKRMVVADWQNADINDEVDFVMAQLLLPLYWSAQLGESPA